MSVFSNPSGRSLEHAQAYTAAIVELLGAQDPIEVLTGTTAALARAVDGVSRSHMNLPEADGKWSISQVLQHLADSELVWGYRLRMVLAEKRPPLTGYDQDLWADRLSYATSDSGQALQEFTVPRDANLRLLARATPADFGRVGVHAERGEESVAHMVRMCAGHDLLHRRQIERIRRAVTRA